MAEAAADAAVAEVVPVDLGTSPLVFEGVGVGASRGSARACGGHGCV
jgi:hypothetical protein